MNRGKVAVVEALAAVGQRHRHDPHPFGDPAQLLVERRLSVKRPKTSTLGRRPSPRRPRLFAVGRADEERGRRIAAEVARAGGCPCAV